MATTRTPRPAPRPLLLAILDGWGVRDDPYGNAVTQARTPELDRLDRQFPHTTIGASGEDVGLPEGQMGNSEVGHLNLGAGRIVYQDLTRISLAIREGGFFSNPVLLQAIDNVRRRGAGFHLAGLLSDGGVHSHNTHIYALLELAKREGLPKVFLHLFLDGRDVPPQSAPKYIEELEHKIAELGMSAVAKIATISGRYYAMDRDRRWDRTKKAFDAMVYGEGVGAASAAAAVERSYRDGAVDEFVVPTVVDGVDGRVRTGDSFIFFNFRPDRARQLSDAFISREFGCFDRGPNPPESFFVSMTEYDATFDVPIAFSPERLDNILPEVLEANGLTQLRIAETEKYAHVTFFFSGGEEFERKGEERRLIPSPKVPTYDLKPEMSAYEVTDAVIEEIESGKYDVIVLNYANMDMVGHTGVLEAAIRAVETVDGVVGRVTTAVLERGGVALVTADHGNAEKMIGESAVVFTAHTEGRVPFMVCGLGNIELRDNGMLADVAPTMLDILGIPKPQEMTGASLLLRKKRQVTEIGQTG